MGIVSTPPKKIILVLGMHRSGTSALTRVISLRGIGLPDNLMPPVEGVNAAGFWESDDIVALHERVLAAAGLSWQSQQAFPSGWLQSEKIQPFREELKALLSTNLEQHDTLVIKDPRTSRMVPLWKQAASSLGVELYFVIAIRNPLEVAASLKARSGFAYQPEGLSYAHSFQLWLRYFLEAEEATRSDRRVFVSYEQLMQNWETVVARIEAVLQFPFPCHSEESTAEIRQFISEGHRHHSIDSHALAQEPEATDTIKEIYHAACLLTEGKKVDHRLFDEAREGKKLRRSRNPFPLLKQSLYYALLALVQPLPERIYRPIRHRLAAKDTPPLNIPTPREYNLLAHYLRSGEQEATSPHPLFDRAYYVQHAKASVMPGLDPFLHFLLSGATGAHNPHPLFDTAYYMSQAGISGESGNPLLHFLAQTRPANPHPLFDMEYYLAQSPDIDPATTNPLVHFVLHGASEGRNPHPLFDMNYYLAENQDVASHNVNPLVHFVLHGASEGRNPHPLFDMGYYLFDNRELVMSGQNPVIHFLEQGWRQGRSPHLLFDITYYLEHNPDVATAQLNPLLHYITRGAREGRMPNRLFDNRYYFKHNPDVEQAHTNPLSHYIRFGADEGRNPHLLFNTAFYKEQLKQKI